MFIPFTVVYNDTANFRYRRLKDGIPGVFPIAIKSCSQSLDLFFDVEEVPEGVYTDDWDCEMSSSLL